MKRQEEIHRRLLGKMSEAERKAFDKRLETDAELIESFQIQKDLMDFFAQEEPELEQKLEGLGKKYFSEKKKPTKKKNWLGIGLIATLLVAGGFAISHFSSDTTPIAPTPNDEKIKTVIPPSPEVQQPPKENSTEEQPTSPKIENTPVPVSPPKQEEPKPIASLDPEDFKVNPTLEDILTEQVRGTQITTLQIPKNGAVLDAKAKLFAVKGTTNAESPYYIVLYSNRPFDFDNDYPTLRQKVAGKPQADDNFLFDFQASLSLSPGLYYLMIQDAQMEMIHLSKFTVK